MNETPSSYLNYLPAVYSRAENRYAGLYLKIFEKVLSGIPADELAAQARIASGASDPADELLARRGLGELLDVSAQFVFPRFSFLFPPEDTAFLPPLSPEQLAALGDYVGAADPTVWLETWLNWQASWVSLLLAQDWDLERKRAVLAGILPLYRMRGTTPGVSAMLEIVTGLDEKSLEIQDNFAPENMIVGAYVVHEHYEDSAAIVGGVRPSAFLVLVTPPDPGPELYAELPALVALMKTVIDREKPIFTSYRLVVLLPATYLGSPTAPALQVGVSSVLGTVQVAPIGEV